MAVLIRKESAVFLTSPPCRVLSVQHVDVGPTTASATAARIVRTVRSLYEVNVNRSHVTEQLIMVFASQLSDLGGRPLSPEAELHLYMQLQQLQMQDRWLD